MSERTFANSSWFGFQPCGRGPECLDRVHGPGCQAPAGARAPRLHGGRGPQGLSAAGKGIELRAWNPKETELQCFHLGPLEAESETRIGMQVAYLGGDLGKLWYENGEARQGRKGQ